MRIFNFLREVFALLLAGFVLVILVLLGIALFVLSSVIGWILLGIVVFVMVYLFISDLLDG